MLLRTYLRLRYRMRSERGASAVEYALLVVAIIAASLAVTTAFGYALSAVFMGTCRAAAQGNC